MRAPPYAALVVLTPSGLIGHESGWLRSTPADRFVSAELASTVSDLHDPHFGMSMTFESLGLCPPLLRALSDSGYENATPVQQQAIPLALTGSDLIVSAQTGSGKTAAFLLPALQRFEQDKDKLKDIGPRKQHGPRLLILTPTRELARQVTQAAQTYARHLPGVRTVAILGGTPYGQQQRMLSRPYDILVATPGRLIDLLGQNLIHLGQTQTLVLDEADRMLDMGFIDDVENIVGRLPQERQTLLFSATVEGDLAGLAQRILRNPQHVRLNSVRESHDHIEQRVYFSDDIEHKKALLTSLLAAQDVDQAIIFTSTRVDADQLAEEIASWDIACSALHGDMRQSARNRTLENMHKRKTKVLVATDVAARGLDVAGISHVINFDLPRGVEDYVHRIGRTGRGGRKGVAISLVSARDRGLLARIGQYTGQHIPASTIAGLEPRSKAARPDNGRGQRPERDRGSRPRFQQDRAARPSQRQHEQRPARQHESRQPRQHEDSAASTYQIPLLAHSLGLDGRSDHHGRPGAPRQGHQGDKRHPASARPRPHGNGNGNGNSYSKGNGHGRGARNFDRMSPAPRANWESSPDRAARTSTHPAPTITLVKRRRIQAQEDSGE